MGKNLTESIVWIYSPVLLDSENELNLYKESPALLEIEIVLSENEIEKLEQLEKELLIRQLKVFSI